MNKTLDDVQVMVILLVTQIIIFRHKFLDWTWLVRYNHHWVYGRPPSFGSFPVHLTSSDTKETMCTFKNNVNRRQFRQYKYETNKILRYTACKGRRTRCKCVKNLRQRHGGRMGNLRLDLQPVMIYDEPEKCWESRCGVRVCANYSN